MKPSLNSVFSLLLLLASTTALSQQVTLISTSATGVKGNGQSTRPDVSSDGRYVAFVSSASNFGTGDSGGSDVFVKDTLTGAISLVSKAADGTPGNGTSMFPISISGDGRYVAFLSFASNLVPNDTNGRYDLFWHDRVSGQTLMVNVASDGTPSNSHADFPAVSGDGRYVAFRSSGTNLVTPAASGNQVYLRDMVAGTTQLISRNASGVPHGGGEPEINADGRWVVYVSGGSIVYLVDAQNCNATACDVRRANVNNLGQPGGGHTSVLFPKVSGDGRFVVWESDAPSLVAGDTNGTVDIFVRDVFTATTERVSVASDGTQTDGSSFTGDISDDGRYVSFTSSATNLAGPDANGVRDMYLHDRQDGQTIRLTRTASGGEPNADASFYSRISGNGLRVVLSTNATNVVTGDTDATEDVYAVDTGPPNQPPVADAGPDLAAAVGERVQLSGLLSSDAETPALGLQYRWVVESAPAGSTATLENAGVAVTGFTPDIPGDYIVSLVVTDEGGLVSEATYLAVVAEIDPAFVYERLAAGGWTSRYSNNRDEYSYDLFDPYGLSGGRLWGYGYQYSYSYDWLNGTYDYQYEPRIGWLDASGEERMVERGDPIPEAGDATFEDFWLSGRSGTALEFYGYGRDAAQNWHGGYFRVAPDGVAVTRQPEGPFSIVGDDESLQYVWRDYWGTTWDSALVHGSKGTYTTRERTVSYRCGTDGLETCTSTYTEYRWHSGLYLFDGTEAELVADTATPVPGESAEFEGFGIAERDAASGTVAFVGYWVDGTGQWHQGIYRKSATGGVTKILDDRDPVLRGGWFGRIDVDGDKVYFGAEGYWDGGYGEGAGGTRWWSGWKRGIYSDHAGSIKPEVEGGGGWFYRWNPDFYQDSYGYSYPDYYNFVVGRGILAFPAYSYFYTYDSGAQSYSYSYEQGTYWKEDGRLRAIARSGDTLAGTQYQSVWAPGWRGDWLEQRTAALFADNHTWTYDSTLNESVYTGNRDVILARFDSDRDARGDDLDNCPLRPNPDQLDADANGVGDLCEDTDLDGWLDPADNCPVLPNNQVDIDDDGPGDACDVCPLVADDQSDQDGDGVGDACDNDADNDTIADDVDNCPRAPNSDQANLEGDLLGDACDPDLDGDGIANPVDGAWDGQNYADESRVFSSNFADHGVGGTSFGRISSRGQLIILVEDAPGSDQGLLIAAVNGSGTGMIKQCDFKGKDASVRLEQGSMVTVTCGSLSVRALARGGQIVLDDDVLIDVQQQAEVRVVGLGEGRFRVENAGETQLPVVVNLNQDIEVSIPTASISEISEPAPGEYEIENVAESPQPIAVTVDGTTTEIEPGETRDVEELRDVTAPVITPVISGTLGNNGWYVGDVHVSWSVEDPQSAVATTRCDMAAIVSDTNSTTFTCTATSAGGTASESVTIKRDATPPQVTIGAPANAAVYMLNQVIMADYACTDGLSGIESCLGAVADSSAIDTGAVGPKGFTVTGTDSAGNSATVTHDYSVRYQLIGFQQPIDNLPVVNTVNAGKTVPVKWQLNDAAGVSVSNLASFRSLGSMAATCNAGAPLDVIEELAAAGGTVLRYDQTSNQFIYNWATVSSWKGKCRKLVLELSDGQQKEALFNFK